MSEFKPVKAKVSGGLWVLVVFIFATTLIPIVMMGREIIGRSNMAFELTPTQVIIRYTGSPVTIKREAITASRLVERPSGGSRLMGTGMPGLYTGRWSFTETGRLRLYATVQRNLVVLETADGVYGITPTDGGAFLAALQSGGVGTWQPAAGQSPAGFGFSIFGFVVVLVGGCCLVLVYYIRLPRTIRYALLDDAVLIEGGRLHLRVPYGEITGAEVASPKGFPLRKIGAQFRGLAWGQFAWKDAGPNLRLYATQSKPLVLIRTAKATYGITPEEQERFVSELHLRREKL